MPIVSISGIRAEAGPDVGGSYVEAMAAKFGSYLSGGQVAVGADTRRTSNIWKDAALAGLLRVGCNILDLGYTSTPSVFKEVAGRRLSGGLIITASHNPPEWNGIKFVMSGGRGVFEEELAAIMTAKELPSAFGRIFRKRPLYLEILGSLASKKKSAGVKVAVDMAGGVGSLFVPSLLARQGCRLVSMLDAPGIFSRMIDPTADPLELLAATVKSEQCDVGFAFDCDADRLVIVDPSGQKLSGDATLLLCLAHFLENSRNRSVAMSVDTSLAAESLVRENNGSVFRSKVGEANVVRKIIENGCGAGGEGSSGGYIDPSFVMCRDGVSAALTIAQMIKTQGSLESIMAQFKRYFQKRINLEVDKAIAPKIIDSLSEEGGEIDNTDGLKIRLDEKSWVLVRSSNTENVMRLSVEADSESRAISIVVDYTKKIKEIEKAIERER